ncbi:hypothetical protein [Variovorax sp. IB41]|uniref:hypothetical protein n=1 Tax=Variovorax sp. IB41 TaxID=2779370 RepID=UPI0018E6FE19|nr:hypothetical protein [Variovorax sp. IB41]MBJ2157938.1 hypothetical protein [Variovorax sp. IB41]
MTKKLQISVEITVDDNFDEANLSDDFGKALQNAIAPHIPIRSAGDLRISRAEEKGMNAMWTKTTCDIGGH